MITFESFVDVAILLDDLNKGCSSKKEIAMYAYDYWTDFQESKKANHAMGCIWSLLDALGDTDDEDCNYWREFIISEIS